MQSGLDHQELLVMCLRGGWPAGRRLVWCRTDHRWAWTAVVFRSSATRLYPVWSGNDHPLLPTADHIERSAYTTSFTLAMHYNWQVSKLFSTVLSSVIKAKVSFVPTRFKRSFFNIKTGNFIKFWILGLLQTSKELLNASRQSNCQFWCEPEIASEDEAEPPTPSLLVRSFIWPVYWRNCLNCFYPSWLWNITVWSAFGNPLFYFSLLYLRFKRCIGKVWVSLFS